MSRGYYISRDSNNKDIVYFDYDKINGFDIKPRNSDKYGMTVNKMIIVKPSMIQKLLIRKIKTRLDLFLKQIYFLFESDDTDGDTLNEALNDLTRYQNIINHKYQKYLEEKYLEKLNKRIDLLQKELKKKQMYLDNHEKLRRQMYEAMYNNMYESYEEEKKVNRSR